MAAIKNKAQELVNQAKDAVQEKVLGAKEANVAAGERKVHGMAAYGPGQSLKPYTYVAKPLEPNQCEIKIECCGICHTDISMINNELGISSFPFVPGHEMVGTVTQVGAQVKDVRAGMRVGVGWFRDCDMACEYCLKGDDNLCSNSVDTIGKGNHGGWADYIRVNAALAFPIPDSIPSEKAAPLLCAGVTVFAPLINNNVTAGMTVGLIGLGGLGHLFVKYAAAMGCKVVVFSTSEEKESDARHLGAAQFILRSDTAALAGMKEKLDFLLSTLYVLDDWAPFLDCVKANGTMCFVGWTPIHKPLQIPPLPLIYRQKRVVGSNVGSAANVRRMLEFSAQHNIHAETEVFSIRRLNDAVDQFRKHPRSNRFRLVVKMDSDWQEE